MPSPVTSARPARLWNATGPAHDFSAIEDIWWPAQEEPEESIIDRAARFRTDLAARHDWTNTLVDQPLGLHPKPDRAKRHQRPMAALRPNRTGARTPGMARVNPAPCVASPSCKQGCYVA